MIARDTPVDILLLRRAQAAVRSGAPDAASEADELGERFAALRARGDRVHLREEARYTLEIRDTPDAALALALDDWRVQKEPLDARIVLEARARRAQAAGGAGCRRLDRRDASGRRTHRRARARSEHEGANAMIARVLLACRRAAVLGEPRLRTSRATAI